MTVSIMTRATAAFQRSFMAPVARKAGVLQGPPYSTTISYISPSTSSTTSNRITGAARLGFQQRNTPTIAVYSSLASPDENTVSTTTTTTADDNGAEKTPAPPRRFIPKPFEYHQVITIRIDSLTNMGWGIGRVAIEDDESEEEIVTEVGGGDGSETDAPSRMWVVMVPHVVVGELVSVRIFRNQKNYSEADLIEVLEPSAHRVEPKCPLAGTCGGCQYQHMSLEAQREWKTKHVEEVLSQQQIQGYESADYGKTWEVLPTVGTDDVYGYRSKITPHYQAPREIGLDEYQLEEIGFQRSSNRNLVDVPECPIATPAINAKYKEVREHLHKQAKIGELNKPTKQKKRKRGGRGGATGATLLFRHADDDENGNPVVVTDHKEYMTTTIKDLKFRYLAGNFFQVNNFVIPLMVDAVVKAATQPTKKGTPPSYLLDCYCGSGLFALSAASSFDACVGIELNEKAIEEAYVNAEMNSISNCHFVAASAEAIFTSPPKIELSSDEPPSSGDNNGDIDAGNTTTAKREIAVNEFPRDQTVVVVDPPRKGCSEEFLKQLYDYNPERIVYMSCGPATQARDAKGIVEIGGYEIVSVQPFDLFPQTKHVESLVVFEKKPVAIEF
ncbi:unnamed protein product [Cylindrotheca closterium]|uniref:TRAM domain-containing protein n=1 Tax=Cylindrotheca closterium TaxID=2856 RepID=A0AAD2CLY8_9STRA|nr:unnamed protein product [Cylindrotheca closterium]